MTDSMSRMNFFLVTDVIVLALQALAIFFNTIVLFALYKVKKNTISIHLVMYLAITDLLHAIAISFYTIYLILNWDPVRIDMDPYAVVISAIPLTFQLKINITLTIAIALDRVSALYAPLQYKMIPVKKYATTALVTGIIFGLFDIMVEFCISPIRRKVDCAAVGCFLSLRFRSYWGISNMVLGLIIIALTAIVLLRLQQMQTRSRGTRLSQANDLSKFAKANKSSASFLLSSLVCLTIPSVIVGGAQLFGFSLFEYVGPFYLVGLLCAGCMNCIVYALFHSGLKKHLKSLAIEMGSNGLIRDVQKNSGSTKTSSYTSRMHCELRQ
ncbi:unnamed protein product [Cylicocyclus nassatus]|uniref:G-protein coupled receptors family 1 profile domain-containing protein n=1 Tax=Cylicocyclus nassatus TaxID=53992 RepID=A0AA36MBM4_CYLNA|nr:unnamed protein product [Cylicocyclus nassatus]